jgi:hypothetical protein
MPCQLSPFPSGIRVWTGQTRANVSMHIESTSTVAKLTNATLNGNALTVTNDSAFSFTIPGGTSVLRLVVQSPDGSDHIQLFEDCGGSQQPINGAFPFDPNDPTRSWQIVAA